MEPQFASASEMARMMRGGGTRIDQQDFPSQFVRLENTSIFAPPFRTKQVRAGSANEDKNTVDQQRAVYRV